MKRIVTIGLGVLAISVGALAQTPAETIERALMAAPRNMKEGATVVKFKADNTWEVLKQGTNKMVCYERSGELGQPPFAIQCTSLANLPRVAQNRKFEAMTDRAARQAALDAAEKDGSRVKPEYGSVWIMMTGQDKDHTRMHTTIAVPGATTATTGLPQDNKQGGVWIMNAGTSTAHLMTPGS